MEAQELLESHTNEGAELLVSTERIQAETQYREWMQDYEIWGKVTTEALLYAYAGEATAQAFDRAATRGSFVMGAGWPEDLEQETKCLRRAMTELASLTAGLRYATSVSGNSSPEPIGNPAPKDQGTPTVFLVHGQNHGKRDTVALFLQNAGPGAKPVILEELANKGRTLVEKLEQHAGDSKFAVVLLTGDDEAGAPGAMRDERRLRARQNVILELGWFCGLLGREKVAVLYESDVELPSDIDGLAYIALDGDWRKRLALELRSAGFDYSIDRLS